MIAESRFKYIWNDGDTDELYDLESDPGEIHNRIDAPAASETLRTLRRELGAWMERTGDPRFPSFQSETQNAPES